MTPAEAALALAARGYLVFPMVPATKRPACAHGVRDATRDPATIRGWFGRPGLAPAIATGEASGVSILDIDRQHGGAAWWAHHRLRLPRTWAWRTPHGGIHLAFTHRPDLRSSVGAIAPGIDIRSDGASAIHWPALGFATLCDAEPAPWPAWLVSEEKPAPALGISAMASITTSERRHRYGQAALRHACERVAIADEGTRNARLNIEAYGLMRLASEGALAPAEIADGLAGAALAAGLDRREIVATIASALRAGGAR